MTITAADSIRTARAHAGLSQVELAARAGVTQSVISTYEAGRRNPSFDMMTKLLGAAGASLVIEYVPDESLPDTVRGRKLRDHREEILEVVRQGGGTRVQVFGSVARGEDGPDSDVDLLVHSADDFSLFEIGGLVVAVSEVLGETVDIVPSRSLPAPIYQNAMMDAIEL